MAIPDPHLFIRCLAAVSKLQSGEIDALEYLALEAKWIDWVVDSESLNFIEITNTMFPPSNEVIKDFGKQVSNEVHKKGVQFLHHSGYSLTEIESVHTSTYRGTNSVLLSVQSAIVSASNDDWGPAAAALQLAYFQQDQMKRTKGSSQGGKADKRRPWTKRLAEALVNEYPDMAYKELWRLFGPEPLLLWIDSYQWEVSQSVTNEGNPEITVESEEGAHKASWSNFTTRYMPEAKRERKAKLNR